MFQLLFHCMTFKGSMFDIALLVFPPIQYMLALKWRNEKQLLSFRHVSLFMINCWFLVTPLLSKPTNQDRLGKCEVFNHQIMTSRLAIPAVRQIIAKLAKGEKEEEELVEKLEDSCLRYDHDKKGVVSKIFYDITSNQGSSTYIGW